MVASPGCLLWHGKVEDCSLVELRIEPDAAAVPLDDLLADGQPYAGPGILILGMQPLEHLEDLLLLFLRDADAVVRRGKCPLKKAI